MSDYHDFIFQTCSLIACNAIDKSCKVEISRVVNVLMELKIDIDKSTITYLATKFGQYSIEDKIEYVVIYEFIVSIFCRYLNESLLGKDPLQASPDKAKIDDSTMVSI
jgi:hypothetical protein